MTIGPIARGVALAILLVMVATPSFAENIDPDRDDSRYAYGENVGWISAEQDTDGDGTPDRGVTVTDDALTGWMWGENVGWISLSCENTASCGDAAYGITNDGCGELAGDAWAENVGWVRFRHGEGGVNVDPTSGEFAGAAWAENAGWVTFASDGPNPYRLKTAWVRSAPIGSSVLILARSGGSTTLEWTAVADASGYDVVEGDLGLLRLGGDFGTATTRCLAEDQAGTTLTHATLPNPGEAFWFLVRGLNCGGNGSYDAYGQRQDHPRDVEIDAGPDSCR